MKYTKKNNIYHILGKWYHIDFSQKSPEIPIIVRLVQKFYLICIFGEENLREKNILQNLIKIY